MTICLRKSQWDDNFESRDEISTNHSSEPRHVIGKKGDLVGGTAAEQLHIPSIKEHNYGKCTHGSRPQVYGLVREFTGFVRSDRLFSAHWLDHGPHNGGWRHGLSSTDRRCHIRLNIENPATSKPWCKRVKHDGLKWQLKRIKTSA